MLDRKLIREQPDFVAAQCRRKGIEPPLSEFQEVDQAWRSVLVELEQKKAEANAASKSIGALIGSGKQEEAEAAKAATGLLKEEIKALEPRAKELEDRLREIELRFPNLPHSTTPDGLNAEANVVVRTWGEKPEGTHVPHWQIVEDLQIIDFEAATKISGSGFAVYKGLGARLVRSLVNFMLDFQTEKNGYHEIYPPAVVLTESLVGTGNLPKFAEDLYRTSDDLWLIPTAEVPVTNLMRDEIIEPHMLPIRYAAYTPCFRREAGAAGRDTRGILRMHQFDKVELVKFVRPETSYAELESLTADAEAILQALGLHYQVIELCAGDIGDKGCKCYDLEVWSPGEGRYLEVSSCTNFEAYQSRRAHVRFRPEPGAHPEFVHILNGSGLAVPRLMVALLETYCRADGTVEIPEALRRYMGTDEIGLPDPL